MLKLGGDNLVGNNTYMYFNKRYVGTWPGTCVAYSTTQFGYDRIDTCNTTGGHEPSSEDYLWLRLLRS